MKSFSNSSQGLLLNIVPVIIPSKFFKVGKLPNTDKDSYRKLRDDHWQTHAFRYDDRIKNILNVSIKPEALPLGEEVEATVEEHLLLTARAIQQAILTKIAAKNILLKANKELLFLGQADQSLLLSQAVKNVGVEYVPGLEVAVRYQIDCRLFRSEHDEPFLGLVMDISTSNRLDIPISKLLSKGLTIIGKKIYTREKSERPYLSHRLRRLGIATSVQGNKIYFAGSEGAGSIGTELALIEPRLENLNTVVRAYYGSKGEAVLRALRQLRYPFSTATGKMGRIKETLSVLKRRGITISNDIRIELGDLLASGNISFPSLVDTERPIFLVGPQGLNTAPYPDSGIANLGPYKFMQHPRNRPLVAVICESNKRGRVDQFLHALKFGFPKDIWEKVGLGRQNPYVGGLVGKFRLSDVRWEVEEISGNVSGAMYKGAVERLLGRVTATPDLAIIQTRESFKTLHGDDNPYFVSKATFMRAGVPTQAITIENIDDLKYGVAFTLNQLALACYAKLDGIPWVISIRGPKTHELIIGLGSSEVMQQDTASRIRYVGVTSVFQGDGRYMVWGVTREAEYERYTDVLLESLRTTLRYVQVENDWQPGDEVLLIFHIYKRLKDREVEAIKSLVSELIKDKFRVRFAFLDLSWQHPYQIIDTKQRGIAYGPQRAKVKGVGVSERGTCLQVGEYRGLLNLTGPTDVKTEEHGLPKPLLVELHPDSDFTDMPYLLRQIFHFTFMSWASFFPSREPVTIRYPRMISRILGNLNMVSGWDSTNLTVGNLRGRRWFL